MKKLPFEECPEAVSDGSTFPTKILHLPKLGALPMLETVSRVKCFISSTLCYYYLISFKKQTFIRLCIFDIQTTPKEWNTRERIDTKYEMHAV
jgi:hypothetical protein